jgi:4-hydroxyacetophenone monooxygenase
VNGSIILFSELTVHYILQSVKYLLDNGYDAMDCKEDAFGKYNDDVDRANKLMAWGASDVSSWYKNATGRVSQNWPFPLLDYWTITRDVDPGAFNFSMARRHAFSTSTQGINA